MDTAIARTVIRFAEEILTEEHQDVADVLRRLEAVGVDQALNAGAHPVRLTTA
ncbi:MULTISPECIES: hypothetical protein [unclassified Streptomyces]|uniref:hypothetical protein n=1 Tax=unclassified Streptomyces TaxID=2593676 RepID=UPI002E11F27E|nr:hypothetical protein OG466_40595 [Streptomyces sp. NBC_01240]